MRTARRAAADRSCKKHHVNSLGRNAESDAPTRHQEHAVVGGPACPYALPLSPCGPGLPRVAGRHGYAPPCKQAWSLLRNPRLARSRARAASLEKRYSGIVTPARQSLLKAVCRSKREDRLTDLVALVLETHLDSTANTLVKLHVHTGENRLWADRDAYPSQPICVADFGEGARTACCSRSMPRARTHTRWCSTPRRSTSAPTRESRTTSRSASRASSTRMSKAETMRLRAAAAAAITLLAGVMMMLAGYVGDAESWTTAGIHRHSGWHSDLGCLRPCTQSRWRRSPPGCPNW
jgi:hypothetical protein